LLSDLVARGRVAKKGPWPDQRVASAAVGGLLDRKDTVQDLRSVGIEERESPLARLTYHLPHVCCRTPSIHAGHVVEGRGRFLFRAEHERLAVSALNADGSFFGGLGPEEKPALAALRCKCRCSSGTLLLE
jgi:hypothetical protein